MINGGREGGRDGVKEWRDEERDGGLEPCGLHLSRHESQVKNPKEGYKLTLRTLPFRNPIHNIFPPAPK